MNGTMWTIWKFTDGAQRQEHYENSVAYFNGHGDGFFGGSEVNGEMWRKDLKSGQSRILSHWNISSDYVARGVRDFKVRTFLNGIDPTSLGWIGSIWIGFERGLLVWVVCIGIVYWIVEQWEILEWRF